MTVGYVLINTVPTKEHIVYNKLLKLPKIVEIEPLFGEYDLIPKVDEEYIEKLGDLVVKKTRTVDGVIDTKTLTGTKF